MKTLPVVEVWWRDAEGDVNTWESTEESVLSSNCPLVRSVGQLLLKNDKTIILATTVSEADNAGRFRIPSSWVDRIIVLRPAGNDEIDIYSDEPLAGIKEYAEAS